MLTSSFKSFLISSLNLETSGNSFISYEKEGGFQSGDNDGTMSSSKNGTHFLGVTGASSMRRCSSALLSVSSIVGRISLLDSKNYIKDFDRNYETLMFAL